MLLRKTIRSTSSRASKDAKSRQWEGLSWMKGIGFCSTAFLMKTVLAIALKTSPISTSKLKMGLYKMCWFLRKTLQCSPNLSIKRWKYGVLTRNSMGSSTFQPSRRHFGKFQKSTSIKNYNQSILLSIQ